jgi:hypothetical protein
MVGRGNSLRPGFPLDAGDEYFRRVLAVSRVLVVLLAWGLAPQIACLMPEQMATQSEMDCCEGVATDCSAANMSQTCC